MKEYLISLCMTHSHIDGLWWKDLRILLIKIALDAIDHPLRFVAYEVGGFGSGDKLLQRFKSALFQRELMILFTCMVGIGQRR